MKKIVKYFLGIVISGAALGLGFGLISEMFYTPSTELSDYYVEPLTDPAVKTPLEQHLDTWGK